MALPRSLLDLVHGSPFPAWVADPQRERLVLNESLRHLTGVDQDTMPFDDWLDLVDERDRPGLQDARLHGDAEGTWDTRYRLRERDGHFEEVREIGLAVCDDDDTIAVVGWISRMHTVSAERDRLAAIIEASADGIITVVSDGTVATWNRAAASLFGYPEEEVVGQPVSQLFAADQRQMVDDTLRAAWEAGNGATPFEAVGLRRDGVEIEVSLAPSAFRSAASEGVVLVVRDITLERQAERELRTEQELVRRQVVDLNQQLRQRLADLETLLDVVPVGIGIANDPACNELRVNPAFARILGISTAANASVTGPQGRQLPFRLYQGGEEARPEDLPMHRAARTGEVVRDEFLEVRRDDGTSAELLAFAAPLRNEDDEPRGAVGVFIDLTERRAVEEALRKANAVKDEFLALVSHELRTPMAVVLGLARLMERRGDALDPVSRQETRRQLRMDAERLGALIENMLLLARLDHEQPRELEPVLVTRVLRRLVDEHRDHHGRTVNLELPDGGLPIVEANQTWVEQIVLNLLSNAEKYAPAGTAIEVWGRHEAEAGLVRIGVRNERTPGADEDTARLFEPFVRNKETLTRPGLGVGLTVCRRLVEAQGGTVDAIAADRTFEISFTLRTIDTLADV